MTWHIFYISHPNYPNLWGQCVVILGSVCSMHCRGNIVLAWSFVFGCFLSLFTCVFHPANIWWHRLMGQLMDRCFNKFCSCKQSALFSKRQNLVTGGGVPLCWSTFTPHERGCIFGAGQSRGCKPQVTSTKKMHIEQPIDQILMHICLWSKRSPKCLEKTQEFETA